MRTALVGIMLGEGCLGFWREYVRPSWAAYAERCGYDLIEITEEIKPHPTKGKAWQKCLLWGHPQLEGYDRIIYLDYDVLILKAAPPIPNGQHGLGCVTWSGSMHRDPYVKAGQKRFWAWTECDWIKECQDKSWSGFQRLQGISDPIEDCLNTGVMVIDAISGPMLLDLFEHGIDNPYSSHEQTAVTLAFMRDHPHLRYDLDRRFNLWVACEPWAHYPWLTTMEHDVVEHMPRWVEFVHALVQDNWFLHFLGDAKPYIPIAQAVDWGTTFYVHIKGHSFRVVHGAVA